ncbi:MAG: hypothetical protein KBT22_04555 [Bacteroidales bacterium]|nr:hypothetical protein [Candidatus Scybalocola fimicaballi]
MRRQVLTTLGIVALCMASYAATFMQVKTDDGKTVSFDVDHVTEVVFDTTSSDHEYVDLGLPSGTLWATCNIGATKPEEFGDYFAWGETEPKENYNDETYKWVVESRVFYSKYIEKTGPFVLLAEDDAVVANWGNGWRMPTNEEQRELVEECYIVWTDNYNNSGVSGIMIFKTKFLSHKGVFNESLLENYNLSDAHIFLPAASGYDGYNIDKVGVMGIYWSSSLCEEFDLFAFRLYFVAKGVLWNDPTGRNFGFPIRAVRSKK